LPTGNALFVLLIYKYFKHYVGVSKLNDVKTP